MSQRLIDFLITRPPRERVLMGLLVMVIAPVALVVGVLLPLRDAQMAAVQAQSEARALRQWVVERAREAEQIPKGAVNAAAPKPISSSAIEESLIDADLRISVTNLGVRDGGVIELQFDAVTFTRLTNWLSDNEANWGYDINVFRFEAIDVPGKVSASLTLTPTS